MAILSLTIENLASLLSLSESFLQEEGVRLPNLVELKLELEKQLTGDFKCKGIKVDGRIVAMCLYRLEPERTFIKRLYTLPAFRKRGFAKQLLQVLYGYQKPLYLHVAPNNRAAMEFYQHLGGIEIFRTYEFKVN